MNATVHEEIFEIHLECFSSFLTDALCPVGVCRRLQSLHGPEDVQHSVSGQRGLAGGTFRISVRPSEEEAPEGSQPGRAGHLRL